MMELGKDPRPERPEPTWPRVANNAIFAVWSLGVFTLIIVMLK